MIVRGKDDAPPPRETARVGVEKGADRRNQVNEGGGGVVREGRGLGGEDCANRGTDER